MEEKEDKGYRAVFIAGNLRYYHNGPLPPGYIIPWLNIVVCPFSCPVSSHTGFYSLAVYGLWALIYVL